MRDEIEDEVVKDMTEEDWIAVEEIVIENETKIFLLATCLIISLESCYASIYILFRTLYERQFM